MPFFVTITTLLAVSAAYLLHQFWSRTFVTDATPAADSAVEPDSASESLKAA